ncbi:MAG: oligosaccharide flippase family protein [Bacteroidota bacterium]
MNPIKKLFGQTAIYGLGTIVPRLVSYLLLTPFYTRIFEKGEYGSVTELYAYVAFLLVMLTYGMETTFFRFSQSGKDPKKVYSTALLTLLLTSSFFIGLVAILNQSIADMIQYPQNENYILFLAIIVGIDTFTAIPFAKLRNENKALKFTLIKITNVVVNVGLNFYFFLVFAKTHTVGIEYVFISNLIASGITLLLLLPDMIHIRFSIDSRLLREMLSYAIPLLIVGLAGQVNENSDKLFLKYLTPEGTDPMEQVGIYSANYKLAVLMTIFVQMFRYAAEPFFFAQAKEKDAKKTYADVLKYFIIFGLLIFLGVMLFLDVVQYFIGSDFREGLAVVPIVLMANLFLGIFFNLSIWYKLENMTRYGAYIAIIGAVITIILNVILIPIIGYMGSAWATFICYFIMMLISYFWGQKRFPVQYPVIRILFYFALAGGIYLFTCLVEINSNTLRYGLHAALFITFIAVAWLTETRKLWQKR